MNSSRNTNAKATGHPDLLMCILSYFGIFALVPFFVRKDDPYISWHARQGVLLMIACFAAYAVLFVLSLIPGINLVAFVLYMVFGLGLLGLSIFCMVQAYQGNKWPIPILSGFLGKIPSAK